MATETQIEGWLATLATEYRRTALKSDPAQQLANLKAWRDAQAAAQAALEGLAGGEVTVADIRLWIKHALLPDAVPRHGGETVAEAEARYEEREALREGAIARLLALAEA